MLRIALGVVLLASFAQAQSVPDLLRQWKSEGTAAGNDGDYYDNRDRGHSELKLGAYPGMLKIPYGEQDKKANRDWGAQMALIPRVVFGNSSTAAPATATGSNSRLYYTNRGGIEFLYQQYTHNNLYVYPEHRDHDPGHNGLPSPGNPEGGYGDLFPTNTAYLITSQGSSGSSGGGTPMSGDAAARIQSAAAKANGGQVSSNSFAARAQSAAAHNSAKSGGGGKRDSRCANGGCARCSRRRRHSPSA